MELNGSNFLIWLFGQIVVGAAIWGGIRVDIKNIHERITELRSIVDQERQRLDRLMER